MKKSKTKINLGLFGLLVISLSMSQGWADASGSANLASSGTTVNTSDPNLTSTAVSVSGVAANGSEFLVENVTASSGGKSFTDDVRVSTATRTEKRRVLKEVVNGQQIFEEREVSLTVASFCSSYGCGQTKEFEVINATADEFNALIRQYAGEALYAQGIAKEEADKKRGDLAKRQEEEKECKREIVDIDDKSKDKKISKSSKEWFSCKLANADDEKEFLKDNQDELEELALSNDKDAQDILEMLRDNSTSNKLSNYLLGLSDANEKYQKAIEAAEYGDYRYAFALNQELMSGSFAYETSYKSGGWGPFSYGGYRTKRRSGSYVEAFADIRADLIERMNIAINGDVDSLVNDGLMTDMNRMCDSAGRGCRTRTSFRSMPRMNFDSGLDTRGMGRGNNMGYRRGQNMGGSNGQTINGQWVPNNQLSFVNQNQNGQYDNFRGGRRR